MLIMKMFRILLLVLFTVVFAGCATIPKQSYLLSEELGIKLNSLEDSHLELLHRFFDQKRAQVDNYIRERWIPEFAQNLFGDPALAGQLKDLTETGSPEDMLNAFVFMGTSLQTDINNKRTEMILPLDELENLLEQKIRNEYNVTRSINNTLTSFLYSASKVDENRIRFMEMFGISQDKINEVIDETDHIVEELVKAGGKAAELGEKGTEYLDKLNELKNNIP
jgi:hypothetical protein